MAFFLLNFSLQMSATSASTSSPLASIAGSSDVTDPVAVPADTYILHCSSSSGGSSGGGGGGGGGMRRQLNQVAVAAGVRDGAGPIDKGKAGGTRGKRGGAKKAKKGRKTRLGWKKQLALMVVAWLVIVAVWIGISIALTLVPSPRISFKPYNNGFPLPKLIHWLLLLPSGPSARVVAGCGGRCVIHPGVLYPTFRSARELPVDCVLPSTPPPPLLPQGFAYNALVTHHRSSPFRSRYGHKDFVKMVAGSLVMFFVAAARTVASVNDPADFVWGGDLPPYSDEYAGKKEKRVVGGKRGRGRERERWRERGTVRRVRVCVVLACLA